MDGDINTHTINRTNHCLSCAEENVAQELNEKKANLRIICL
jgi:hypothetical protein